MLRYAVPILVLAVIPVALTCHAGPEPSDSRVRFVTTLPVFASIVRPIVGDDYPVHILLDDNRSPHDYLPRPSDVRRIAAARVLVLGHPELDGWAENFGSSDFFYISDLVEAADIHTPIGLSAAVVVGNPHFWLDPVIVSRLTESLASRLCGSIEEECGAFQDRAMVFASSLDSLTISIGKMTSPLRGLYLVSVDPFFDLYFKRFGIHTAGSLQPFHGQRPTPASVISTLESGSQKSARAIVTEMNRSDELATMFREESGLPIIYLDPIGDRGTSYPTLLLDNTNTLLESIPVGK